MSALELPPVLDVISIRNHDLGVYSLADIVDHSAHVSSLDVGLHHDFALYVLATDGIGAPLEAYVREIRERHGPTGGHVHTRHRDPRLRVAQLVGIPHHQVERALALQHLGYDLAIEGDVHGLRQPAGRHAEASHCRSIGPDRELRHVGLLFHLEVHEAFDVFDRSAHALGNAPQLVQIGPENLHGDRRSSA